MRQRWDSLEFLEDASLPVQTASEALWSLSFCPTPRIAVFFPPLYSLNRAVTKTAQLMWLRSASSHLVCGDAAGWALSTALSLSRIWLLQKQKNLFQGALTEWPEWSELNLSARSSMHRILLPCVVSVTGFHQCCSACTCKSMNATIIFRFFFFAKLCNKMICLCLQALNTSKQLF